MGNQFNTSANSLAYDQSKDKNYSLNPTFNDSIFEPETLISHVESLHEKAEAANEKQGIFLVRTANKWIEQAKTRPIPKMLFSELWYEGEICILFADTNLGKSILAVQIGDSISKGEQIRGFKLEAPAQKVLYFDFELSDKQFEIRYSCNFENHYQFDANFFRAEINPDADNLDEFSTFEEYLSHSLEKAIIKTGAKVLIIDNLTYLKNETEKAKDALPLMKQLKALKNKYGLSVLALAHTPKRDLSKPITRNDLSGSKMLMNFCDSSFAIGESNADKYVRYIKQIKVRNTENLYDADNVFLCQVEKSYNFLQFQFLDFGAEREHLKIQTEKDKEQRIEDVLVLKSEGLSNVEIAKRFQVSEGAVRKWIKKANESQTTS